MHGAKKAPYTRLQAAKFWINDPRMRLDQWLRAVRVFRARSLAAGAIHEGRVPVDGAFMKPAHTVRAGETVVVQYWEHQRTWCVLGTRRSRLAAPDVGKYAHVLLQVESSSETPTAATPTRHESCFGRASQG